MKCKFMFRALTVLVAGLTIAACSDDKAPPRGNIGSVGLAIQLSETVAVDSVRYSITGNGLPPIEGTIAVSDRGAKTSALIDVAAGSGYTVELAAVSTDLGTTCIGEAGFDIVAGQTTALSLILQCHGEDGAGSVAVDAVFNNCPVANAVVVAPRSVAVGGKVTVSAVGSDKDAADSLTYAWSAASGGAFAASTQAATSFTCAAPGTHQLSLVVSDGKCNVDRKVDVTCTP